MTTFYDLADYRIAGDGVGNDRQSILDFKADAQGVTDAELSIPSGAILYIGPRASSSNVEEDYLFDGIPGLIVNSGSSVAFTDNGTNNDYHFGARQGQYQDNAHSARLYTATAGTNYAQLKDISKAGLFSVGHVALITGFDLQGWWHNAAGFPSNHFYFQWVVISQIIGDVITFDTLLRETYKDTWPELNSGTSGEVDNGGPATLYAIDQRWNCNHTYNGFTADKTGGPNPQGVGRKATNATGRFITFNGVTATNKDIINPSLSVLWRALNCDFTGSSNDSIWEVDKYLTDLVADGTDFHDIQIQSSNDTLTLRNFTAAAITGSFRRTVLEDGTISGAFNPCPNVHGRPDTLSATRVAFNGGIGLGGLYKGVNESGVDSLSGGIAMSSGVITIPNTVINSNGTGEASQLRWCPPDTWCMWVDQDRTCIGMWQVVDVTQDATNTYVETTESGGFPSYNSAAGGKLFIRVHPAPQCTFRDCTGQGAKFNNAPAGAPLYSYTSTTYDGTAATSGDGSYLWGDLVRLTMDVTVATAGAKTFNPIGDFCWLTLADGSLSPYPGYAPVIDFHTAVPRVVTVPGGSQSNSGFQIGDSAYTLPEVPAWFANRVFGLPIGGNLTTGSQSITVTVQTDQGLPLAAIAGSYGLTGNAVSFSKTTANPIKVHFRRKKV